MTRVARRYVSYLLLGALFFLQGVVAAYACPTFSVVLDQPLQVTQTAAMPTDCGQMRQMSALDGVTPNLCLAHCQSSSQSNDNPQSPTVQPVVIGVLVVPHPTSRLQALSRRAAAFERVSVAASPPHSILHCCFRL